MKYFSVFFLVFLFSANLHAQFTTNVYWTEQSGMPASEVIYYNPSKNLQWPDFKGASNTGGIVAAITMSGFGYKASMKNNGSNGQLNIGVYCYFNKDKSWVKLDKKTGYILNHEQHHFDISFIAATIFAGKIRNAVLTAGNSNAQLQSIYKECCDLMNKLQDDYDGQTRNGQVKEVQQKWNDYLDKKLAMVTK
ncbi:MAG: hypothetical protein ABJA37_07105 [Ferruginibacter sp.]